MVTKIVVWGLVLAYLGGVLLPRLYWLLAGRPCPRCDRGRLWFQGLAANPWVRLRSWWRCGECRSDVEEVRWGWLESGSN
jgi:hypothetical protein